MPLKSKKSRTVLFFVFGIGLAVLMAGLKAAIAWAAHTYLYSVPWLGGFLRSIELLEISNLFIFAIFGACIGVATVWLPRRWNHRAKLAVLLVLSPLVFSASYMMQQNLWIKDVAARGNISYREARDITNTYLQKEVGSGGFFGFYPFSTQLAELPTRLETLSAEQSVNPSDLLSQELASYGDPRADMAAYVFERVGWLIRFMYMTIALLTGLIYYFKGHSWAENRSLSNVGPTNVGPTNVPSRPTPRKKASGAPKTSSSRQRSKLSGSNASGSPASGSNASGSNASDSNASGRSPDSFSSKPISKPYINSPPDMPRNAPSNEPPNMPLEGPIPKSPSRPPSDSSGDLHN